jgi:hypothetical protein
VAGPVAHLTGVGERQASPREQRGLHGSLSRRVLTDLGGNTRQGRRNRDDRAAPLAATGTPPRGGGKQSAASSNPSVMTHLTTHGIPAESPQRRRAGDRTQLCDLIDAVGDPAGGAS